MLKQQISDDMKAAMKAGDSTAKMTTSMLLSAIKNRELDKRSRLAKDGVAEGELDAQSVLTDEEVIEVIGSEIKKRKESITTYEEAGRAEMAAGERAEVEVLSRYLPEQMDEVAVKQLVADAVAESGATSPKDMGKVMGILAPQTKGRFDNAQLAQLVREALTAK